MPRLGEKFHDIDISVISKPREEYGSAAHSETGLPKAPAIMAGDRVLIAGADIEEEKLISEIRQQLQSMEGGDRQ